ncbi:hypothetical protein [Actinomadura rupiterrae]|uniref:hypothetical protein n=1 Tax=Actinomadura rupiterrae TaxID=559627 RepID=UPI0020A3DDAC|nr:hypothetical protein [Actinomadura rupiterrae]MCP2339189.1 hypothetical protein [Actinomadura rupiterrae]
MTTNDLCVTDHGDDERRALPALRLCARCYYDLRFDLDALPRLYDALAEALAVTGGAGQRVTGSSGHPLPINPAVAGHRDQIRHDLIWWALHVADARGLTLPESTVRAVAELLAHQVDWIAATLPAAAESPPVFAELVRRARSLLDPVRRLATGERCRSADEDGQRCTGTVSMVLTRAEAWEARCSRCGPQEAAPYLRDTIAGRMVTAERVQTYALRSYGQQVTASTIRSWAHRGHIRSEERGGSVWYDLGSVSRYLAARQGRMAG